CHCAGSGGTARAGVHGAGAPRAVCLKRTELGTEGGARARRKIPQRSRRCDRERFVASSLPKVAGALRLPRGAFAPLTTALFVPAKVVYSTVPRSGSPRRASRT